MQLILKAHGIEFFSGDSKASYTLILERHICELCDVSVGIFKPVSKDLPAESVKNEVQAFPPPPPSKESIQKIIREWCSESSVQRIKENGCAVCGQLTPLIDIEPLEAVRKLDLACITKVKSTRAERQTSDATIEQISGPVLDPDYCMVCIECVSDIKNKKCPKYALANGLWIGQVPTQLSGLNFAEQMLILRVHHNRCLMRVSSERAKLVADTIIFATPVVKMYHTLPPTVQEAGNILAVIFMGHSQPTDKEFKKCPMLVHRQKISDALEWLKLNHVDYANLTISKDNLDQYPLNGVPVVVDFRKVDSSIDPTDKLSTEMSKHETEVNVATETGPCSIIVHGITGTSFTKLSLKALKLKALVYIEQGRYAPGCWTGFTTNVYV
jgi:hypothetical protein